MTSNVEDIRQHIDQVLGELGRGLDIDLALDRDNACYFEHNDGWRMAILYPGKEQVVAAVSVLSGVTASDEEVWPVLVELGWLGAETDGASLSWNPESRSFVLWYSRDALATTPEKLNALLLRLCRAVAVVRPALTDRLFSRVEDAEQPADPAKMFRV